jgi:hypothetical protein
MAGRLLRLNGAELASQPLTGSKVEKAVGLVVRD